MLGFSLWVEPTWKIEILSEWLGLY
jgi:hypothetical protein